MSRAFSPVSAHRTSYPSRGQVVPDQLQDVLFVVDNENAFIAHAVWSVMQNRCDRRAAT